MSIIEEYSLPRAIIQDGLEEGILQKLTKFLQSHADSRRISGSFWEIRDLKRLDTFIKGGHASPTRFN